MNWHGECFLPAVRRPESGSQDSSFLSKEREVKERKAMTTFMKKLFWSATAGLTMFVFLPQAKAQGRGGMRIGGRQMMMNSNMMGRMMTPNMMTPNMMTPSRLAGRMMNGNMMGGHTMTGGTMTGTMTGMTTGTWGLPLTSQMVLGGLATRDWVFPEMVWPAPALGVGGGMAADMAWAATAWIAFTPMRT